MITNPIFKLKSIIQVLGKFDEVLQILVLNELILVEIEQNVTCKVILWWIHTFSYTIVSGAEHFRLNFRDKS